ncbi:MAG: glycerophosphodiester phosphodiesterase family protein [Pseudomonadota bacterium]
MILKNTQPILSPIIGHRGLAALKPENTLLSFQAAVDAGILWVEFDVMLTQDKVPIVFHDDNLLRVAGLDQRVKHSNWRNLSALDVGSWFDRDYHAARIPSLKQVLMFCEHVSLNINLEIKPHIGDEIITTEAVLQELDNTRFKQQILISSYSIEALRHMQNHAPEVPRGWLSDTGDKSLGQILVMLEQLESFSFHAEHSQVTPPLVARLKQEHYRVLAHTVNQLDAARNLWGIGVDAVFSDFPLFQQQ